MRWVFALSLVLGMIALIGWVLFIVGIVEYFRGYR